MATAAGVALGVGLTSLMVVRTTQAVFSGYSSTPSNTWATGGATLSNDATASAVFSQANDGTLAGGQVLSRCIVVTYVGATTPAAVRLYATASGALNSYLSLVVDQGSGTPGNGSCTGFSASSAGIYSGTVAGFATAANAWGSGVGSWSPTVGATMTYRFTVTVQNHPSAQNATGSATFTWEAQA
ncbi:hypothetical protein [Pilimelia anulata]|uniref:hypothetical protein n=1 Tax=Pilimelia anulata TaxID=53371 RepID=UPI0016635A23|nr:hypothetical protein [Pilimelia anulata]